MKLWRLIGTMLEHTRRQPREIYTINSRQPITFLHFIVFRGIYIHCFYIHPCNIRLLRPTRTSSSFLDNREGARQDWRRKTKTLPSSLQFSGFSLGCFARHSRRVRYQKRSSKIEMENRGDCSTENCFPSL